MYKITIKNLRNEKPQNLWDIVVDRSSALGNPFYMYEESQRDEVCDKYEKWFKDVITNKEKDYPLQRKELDFLINTFKQHKQLNLFCWCSPKRCHAETIKNYILSLSELTWDDLENKINELYIIRKGQISIIKTLLNYIEIPDLKLTILQNGFIIDYLVSEYSHIVEDLQNDSIYKNKNYNEIYNIIKDYKKAINNTLKILCPFCNKEWTATMKHEFDNIQAGCDTCGYGATYIATVEIHCEHCKRLIYKKEYKN